MINLVLKVIFAYFLIPCLLLGQPQEVKMSLVNAVTYAQNHEWDFQATLKDKKIIESEYWKATSRFFPKLSGSANLRFNIEKPTIVIASFDNEGFNEVKQGTRFALTAGLFLEQLLFDGRSIADLGYAHSAKLLSELSVKNAKQALVFSVIKAYSNVLLQDESYQLSESIYHSVQNIYKDAQEKYINQAITKTDLDVARLTFLDVQIKKDEASYALEKAKWTLAQRIGLDEEVNIVTTDSLSVLIGDIENFSFDEIPLSKLEENIIDIQAEKIRKDLNIASLRRTYYGYIPSISFYGYFGATSFRENFDYFTKAPLNVVAYLGARITLPVFDGLEKVFEAQRISEKISQNNERLERIRNQAIFNVKDARQKGKLAAQTFQVKKEQVEVSRKILKDIEKKEKEGTATIQDFLDKLRDLRQAQSDYAMALYTVLIAKVEWWQAIGEYKKYLE